MVRKTLKRIVNRIKTTAFPTTQTLELRRWYKENGDCDKRFDYPLTSESVVIDLGGYDGQWASDLFSRYMPKTFIFEAIPGFAEKISRRFAANKTIATYSLAIGKNHRTDQMYLDGVGSSLSKESQIGIPVQVEDAAKLLEICGVTHCNLLKINIEGGEYEVLPRIIYTGLIDKIDNLLIQFHNIDSRSLAMMSAIQTELEKTHELTWQYTWIWENWKRRAS